MQNLSDLESQVTATQKPLSKENASQLVELIRRSFPDDLFIMHTAIGSVDGIKL